MNEVHIYFKYFTLLGFYFKFLIQKKKLSQIHSSHPSIKLSRTKKYFFLFFFHFKRKIFTNQNFVCLAISYIILFILRGTSIKTVKSFFFSNNSMRTFTNDTQIQTECNCCSVQLEKAFPLRIYVQRQR